MEGEIITTISGAFLADVIPIREFKLPYWYIISYNTPVKYTTAWFPRANFKRIANRYRIVSELLTKLYGINAKQAGTTNEDMAMRSIKDAASVAFLGTPCTHEPHNNFDTTEKFTR